MVKNMVKKRIFYPPSDSIEVYNRGKNGVTADDAYEDNEDNHMDRSPKKKPRTNAADNDDTKKASNRDSKASKKKNVNDKGIDGKAPKNKVANNTQAPKTFYLTLNKKYKDDDIVVKFEIDASKCHALTNDQDDLHLSIIAIGLNPAAHKRCMEDLGVDVAKGAVPDNASIPLKKVWTITRPGTDQTAISTRDIFDFIGEVDGNNNYIKYSDAKKIGDVMKVFVNKERVVDEAKAQNPKNTWGGVHDTEAF